jgi:GGDEF domain-containing protein
LLRYRAPLFAAVNSVATVLIVILALLSIFVAVMNMISFALMDGENNCGGGMATLGISLEIAAMEKTDTQTDAVLIRADYALYRAKSSGRNRVKVTCQRRPE